MQLLQLEGDGAPHLGPWAFIEEHFTRSDASAGPDDSSNRRVGLDVELADRGVRAVLLRADVRGLAAAVRGCAALRRRSCRRRRARERARRSNGRRPGFARWSTRRASPASRTQGASSAVRSDRMREALYVAQRIGISHEARRCSPCHAVGRARATRRATPTLRLSPADRSRDRRPSGAALSSRARTSRRERPTRASRLGAHLRARRRLRVRHRRSSQQHRGRPSRIVYYP